MSPLITTAQVLQKKRDAGGGGNFPQIPNIRPKPKTTIPPLMANTEEVPHIKPRDQTPATEPQHPDPTLTSNPETQTPIPTIQEEEPPQKRTYAEVVSQGHPKPGPTQQGQPTTTKSYKKTLRSTPLSIPAPYQPRQPTQTINIKDSKEQGGLPKRSTPQSTTAIQSPRALGQQRPELVPQTIQAYHHNGSFESSPPTTNLGQQCPSGLLSGLQLGPSNLHLKDQGHQICGHAFRLK